MGCCTGPGAVPDDIIKTVRARVNGVDEPAVMLEVANTVRDFCLETTLWRADVSITLEQNKTRYKVNAPEANSEVAYVLAVLKNSTWVPARAGNFPLDPNAYWYIDFRELGYIRTSASMVNEDTGSLLYLHVYLFPCKGGVEIPFDLAQRHHDTIVAGACMRLHKYNKRPFTNLGLAADFEREYRSGISHAKHIARQGSTMYGRTWIPPYFAAGTGHGRKHGTFPKGGL